jgi:hypothetical protein
VENDEHVFDDKDRITNWMEPIDISGDGKTTELQRLRQLIKESRTGNHFAVRMIKHPKTNKIALARAHLAKRGRPRKEN